jgi:hypothetical protein
MARVGSSIHVMMNLPAQDFVSKNNLPRVPEMIALCELTGLTLDWIYRGETGSIDPAVALKLPKRGDV